MSVSNSTANCPHCGMVHQTTCPRIKSIEYQPDGVTVKRLEFYEPMVPDQLQGWFSRGMQVGGAIVYDSYEDYVFDGEPKS